MENNIKKIRGQFFTTKNRVLNAMVSLIQNEGVILEPSAGSGHIVKHVEDVKNRKVSCVELDETKVKDKVCQSHITTQNFFEYINHCGLFNTIIGNPPFVKLKNVETETTQLLPEKIPGNGNLYYYFIKYSANLLYDDGELIFIVPKEWLYNVSASFVRDYLKNNGGFTHFIDCGEEKLFDDADVPALCIFRFVKGYSGKVKFYQNLDGYYNNEFELKDVKYTTTIAFTNSIHSDKKVSDYFDVKVGLVTGDEKFFRVGDTDIPEEYLINIMGSNRRLDKYLFLENFKDFNLLPDFLKTKLLSNKKKLINRKIKKFDEKNWWHYGALRNMTTMESNKSRIYGLMKTRQNDIFWVGNQGEYFGGGIVGLFVKDNVKINLDDVTNYLNSEEFKNILKENNMYTNNKVNITPSVLSNLPFTYKID